MTKLKILSYNVFWKTLEPEKEMKHCIVDNKNKCLNTILTIITSRIDNDYDFIGLQEITKDQFEKYLLPTLKVNEKLFNYKSIYGSIDRGGVITLYNKNKFNPKYSDSGNLDDVASGEHRPYQYIIFKEKLIFINIQLPHKSKSGSNDPKDIVTNIYQIFTSINEYLSSKKDNIENYRIIIIGDFNNDNAFTNFELHKYKFRMPSKKFPNTCCYNKFDKKFDNIYSTFGDNKIYTLKQTSIDKINKDGKNWMSDHLPIISIITDN